jgi:sarcosine oxidase subunit alpha
MVDSQRNRVKDSGYINRDRKVRFRFNGRDYTGYAGDTLASALLANDVHLVGRSFKYHRPRGIATAGIEEHSALVQLGPDMTRTEPNIRATQVELYDGLEARSQNCSPSVKFDTQAINDFFHPLLPAGFYYKTFMWPRQLWEGLYERAIRKAAGLGKAPRAEDPERYDHHYTHADVLVAGGGPSGLMASLSAARAGARVIIADENAEFGGALLGDTVELDGKHGRQWAQDIIDELKTYDDVTILPRTTVAGYYAYNYLTLVERVQDHLPFEQRDPDVPRQRFWQVRTKQAVLATGAIERHMVFHQNDRPGIMLAGAAQYYANRFGVCPGKNIVVATNNNSAYRAALDLQKAGARVQLIDVRANPDGASVSAAEENGLIVYKGYTLLGTSGRKRIQSVRIAGLDTKDEVKGQPQDIDCDLLCVSGGWNPVVHLHSHTKSPIAYDDNLASFVPRNAFEESHVCCGFMNGAVTFEEALKQGAEAGVHAAKQAGFDASRAEVPGVGNDTEGLGLRAMWKLPSDKPAHKERAFVDLQNDVTAKDLKLALQEGYDNIEHVKRYTTTGMATDQGKTANVNALGIVAKQKGVDIPEVGYTTFRQPYSPISFGAIVGRNFGYYQFAPRRRTPMHDWHVRNGAVFEDAGGWMRPFCYPREGETEEEAVQREAYATRTSVGVLDASTLGKIDIQGPDAAEFLNRVYTNKWNKLKPGRCRYGVMCGEDGMVMDDGVTACIEDNHYHMTTTTGGAAKVMAWLEEWLQTEWPDMRVSITSTTDQWAVASFAGPNARKVAEKLVDDIDISPEALPFMGLAMGHVCGGIPGRIFRISFSGESGFEINVPASYGQHMWEQVMAAGAEFNITPYGTEVMHLLRAEKGFIIVGQDTDGDVTPLDMNLSWAVSSKKDFIGKRSLYRADMQREDREQLVGIVPEDPNFVPPEGSQILEPNAREAPPVPMQGYVTSSYYSPVLGHAFALAMVTFGMKREGERLMVETPEHGRVPVKVVDSVFYDKEGARLRE